MIPFSDTVSVYASASNFFVDLLASHFGLKNGSKIPPDFSLYFSIFHRRFTISWLKLSFLPQGVTLTRMTKPNGPKKPCVFFLQTPIVEWNDWWNFCATRFSSFPMNSRWRVQQWVSFLMKTSNLIWNMRRDNLYSESWFSAHPRQPKDVKTKYSDDFCDRYKSTLGAKRVCGVGNVV
jgi:hypothetical protein